MSPFANSPQLWLTAHVQRVHLYEPATKIQAVVRGYLYRRGVEKERNAQAVLRDVLYRLQVPPNPLSLVDTMRKLGLDIWADRMPNAADCLLHRELADYRQNLLWNAGISLRLTGQSQHIADLQWADYHERNRALQDLRAFREAQIHPESMWTKVKKFFWG